MQPPKIRSAVPKWYGAPTEEFLLHILLVALNHVFDHLATD